MFIERTIRMLKKFGQRPGVRRTFRFSSRTPQNDKHLNFFFYFFLTTLIIKENSLKLVVLD